MNKLEELMAELCPNGVPQKRLDESCNILIIKGSPSQNQQENSEYIPITEPTEYKIMYLITFSMALTFSLAKTEVLLLLQEILW